jgi:sugar transferase (PEP-CTERM system associated)
MRVLLQNVTPRGVTLVGLETVLIVASVVTSTLLLSGGEQAWRVLATPDGLFKVALIALVCQTCLFYSDLYDLRVVSNRYELFVRTLQSLSAMSLILGIVYFWFPDAVIGRGVVLAAAFLVLTGAAAWRVIFERAMQHIAPRERVLIIGTNPAALSLATELCDRKTALGVEVVGFVTSAAAPPSPVKSCPILGRIEDIPRIVEARRIDRVVVSLTEARGALPMQQLLDMKLSGVSFEYLESVYERYTRKIAVANLRPSWLIFSAGFRATPRRLAFKRAADVVVSLIGLTVALPVMALVALAVKLSSNGPVLYHQQRVGERGRPFTLHKFRSMRADAEAATGAVWCTSGDARVTPIGKFLRKARLDELPQLWNVLSGEMSLVGPRPERPEFIDRLAEQIPFYGQRHVVKPGVTGWAQIRYGYGSSIEDALEKLQYDLFYIKHMSFGMDLFILAATAKTIMLRKGT